MNVLVIAAHPDDEVLGCGAAMARLAQEGHQVAIAIFGEGITSRFPEREQANPEDIRQLHGNSHQVKELLGAKELFMYSLPDNRFDTVPLLEVTKLIEGLVTKLRPEVIYTHHGGDLNIDHVVLNRATLTATRPMAGCPVKEIYAYEVLSSTEWSFGRLEQPFAPNVFVDVSATLEHKVKAMSLYESEARIFPHPRSAEAIRNAARRWGSVIGCQAAEAFELIRAIR